MIWDDERVTVKTILLKSKNGHFGAESQSPSYILEQQQAINKSEQFWTQSKTTRATSIWKEYIRTMPSYHKFIRIDYKYIR